MAELWHGMHEVPLDQMITVTVGPLVLSIAHRPGEWRIGWYRGETNDNNELWDEAAKPASEPGPITDPDVSFTAQRFLTQGSGNSIHLLPLLADRPMVARPDLPLRVPAGEEATIFVSTPLWVKMELPEPSRTLMEVPTIRPSDTWFGPDTRRGVVAYASHTAARLRFDQLPPQAHRAITPVLVRNHSSIALPLERLSVPAPNLPLFVDKGGGFWTASLTATQDSGSSPAKVELSTNSPDEAWQAKRVAEPREENARNVFSRALHVLVG